MQKCWPTSHCRISFKAAIRPRTRSASFVAVAWLTRASGTPLTASAAKSIQSCMTSISAVRDSEIKATRSSSQVIHGGRCRCHSDGGLSAGENRHCLRYIYLRCASFRQQGARGLHRGPDHGRKQQQLSHNQPRGSYSSDASQQEIRLLDPGVPFTGTTGYAENKQPTTCRDYTSPSGQNCNSGYSYTQSTSADHSSLVYAGGGGFTGCVGNDKNKAERQAQSSRARIGTGSDLCTESCQYDCNEESGQCVNTCKSQSRCG